MLSADHSSWEKYDAQINNWSSIVDNKHLTLLIKIPQSMVRKLSIWNIKQEKASNAKMIYCIADNYTLTQGTFVMHGWLSCVWIAHDCAVFTEYLHIRDSSKNKYKKDIAFLYVVLFLFNKKVYILF